jgi:hypothetical protein
MRSLALTAAAAWMLGCAVHRGSDRSPPVDPDVEHVVDIPSRPGVTVRTLLTFPAGPPRAAVVLLAGGHGGIELDPDGSMGIYRGNFLVRARHLFARQGLLAAVVDAPSDHALPPYVESFRTVPAHAEDLAAVIGFLRQKASVPVWLVGTSLGTVSAAYAVTQLEGSRGPDGVVLTSTALDLGVGRTSVPQLPLRRIRVPVLIVHHVNDECMASNAGSLPLLTTALTGSPRVEVRLVDGGSREGLACGAFSHHGYLGVEPEVVGIIARFVVGDGARRTPQP